MYEAVEFGVFIDEGSNAPAQVVGVVGCAEYPWAEEDMGLKEGDME